MSTLSPLQSGSLAGLPGIAHGFFTRHGGVSTGLYTSLNCGLGSRDDRAAVLANRDRAARHLGSTGDRLLTCFQIHSATAITVDRPWAPDSQPKADAIVTRTRGLVLGALAADCAPVLFADQKAGVVAAAHAGWKGALGGILESTLEAMEAAGAARSDITAVIGPCIGAAAYEVGPEFEATFLAADCNSEVFFSRRLVSARPHFDLPGYVAARLKAAGAGLIDGMAQCTYESRDAFFSFRRATHAAESDYGRQISAIVLT